MDILTTQGLSRKQVEDRIDCVERSYDYLRRQNEMIRALVLLPNVAQAMAADGVDVDAALISSCRSDMLNCGRCAFWNTLRKHNIQDA